MKRKNLDNINHAPLHARRSFVIGCGGMGAEAASHFKRAMSQQFDSRKMKALQVLCFDSAQPDYSPSLEYLETQERVRVYSSQLRKVIEDLEVHPRISAWFPSETLSIARDVVRELSDSAQGAASTRPFGRIGLFEHWESVYSRLRSALLEPIGSEQTLDGQKLLVEDDSCDFYIVTSLGGGTGTGIFLDLAALIRKLQKDLGQTSHKIHAVLVLPDILVRDRKIPRRYAPLIMANSYAALKEIDNFLHAQGFDPENGDDSGTSEDPSSRGQAFEASYGDSLDDKVTIGAGHEIGRLFDNVYLAEGENSHGKECASRDEVARLVGEMLFHLAATKIGRDLENRLPDMKARQFFQEERPEESKTEELGNIVRERRRCLYSTFGHTTLHIPIATIIDYCARQRALETMTFMLGGHAQDDPDAVAERVAELMKGSGAEPPILEQLGVTSGKLTRALDISKYVEELPRVDAILDDRVPSEALREYSDKYQWTSAAREKWAARVKSRGDDAQRRLITGAVNVENKGDKPQVQEGRLAQLVNTLTAKEGPGVVDVLLDRMEEELTVIQSHAEEELVGLQRELEVHEDGGSNNRFWREIQTLVNDIHELERRRGPLRAWFNGRRVGQFLEDTLDALQRLRHRYLAIPVLTEKIALCRNLIEEINRQDDVVLSGRITGLRSLRKELRSRRDAALADCVKRGGAVKRTVARRLPEFYSEQYLGRLGGDERPRALADRLRKEGITLADGSMLPFERWGDRPMEVVDALHRVCADVTNLDSDAELSELSEGKPSSLWNTTYDSSFFSDSHKAGDDFDTFGSELQSFSEPYLRYGREGTPSVPWHRLISGSCCNDTGRHWTRWVKLEGMDGDNVYPGLPNQVTLISMRMAFPLFRLERIREWKRHYDDYLERGWPLHLFKNAHEWSEPFIEEVESMDYDPEQLLTKACEYRVVRELPSDATKLYYDNARTEIQALFQNSSGESPGLNFVEFKKLLERNRILAQEIVADIVEHVREQEDVGADAKWRQPEFPQFLRREIEEYLGEA